MCLQFADDNILFLSEDRDRLSSLLSVLQFSERVSGLRINMSNSGMVSVNLDGAVLAELSTLAGCGIIEWPMTYLGISIGGDPWEKSFWDLVVERVSKHLDNWKGGLLTLVCHYISFLSSGFRWVLVTKLKS